MKKSMIAVLIGSALGVMGSAQAATYYLDGHELPADNHTLDGNLVSGLLVEGGSTIGGSKDYIGQGTPSKVFDTTRSLNMNYKGLTVNGGDLIGGHYLRAIGNDEKYDAGLQSITLNVTDSVIAENLIAGHKFLAYGSSQAHGDIKNLNVMLDNTKVNMATIVGSQLKSSGKDINGSVANAKVTVQNGSKLNGLILGGVAAYMSGDNTAGASTVSKVGHVDLTIKDSTVEALTESSISGLKHDFKGAAIVMGGVSSNATTLEVTGDASVESVQMTIAGTKVNGNVLMGGVSSFAQGKAVVKHSALVLGEGTDIQGAIVANGIGDVKGNATVTKADIVLDSSKVTIKDGITDLGDHASLSGTGKFKVHLGSPGNAALTFK